MIFILNPFFIWLLLGILTILLMWISPNRYEFINDIKNFVFDDTTVNTVLLRIVILYLYIPTTFFLVIQSFKK